MLERLSGWFRLLWDSSRILQEHTESIESSKARQGQFFDLAQLLLGQNLELKHQNLKIEAQIEAEREARKTELEHERELRRKGLENLELRLRLEIAEKLRHLPPNER